MGFHNAAEHDVLFFLYFVIGLACVIGTTAYIAYGLVVRLYPKSNSSKKI
jgi:hypothetical protein